MQSLGENKAGYRAVFPPMKTSIKLRICWHWFLYPPDNVLPCKTMLVRYQLFITFLLCYCL